MYFSRPLLTVLLFVVTAHFAFSQQKDLYSYQQLSHLFYQKQIDSLKKAWVCPETYKEKAVQKKYREIWDDRTTQIIRYFTNDNYVFDQELYQYVQEIINQLAAASPQLIPVKPLLLLDRSPSANAYATGGNLIAVNLGMLSFVQSREELAMVIAHELSHNILSHAEFAMQQKAEWLTSDEYKESLNSVLDSKYNRLTRLKKIFENFSFDRSRHQRFKESEADSLAILMVKKSNLAFDAFFFKRLDSSDMEYKLPLKKALDTYLLPYGLPFENAWTQKRSKGLSTRAYNFSDTSRRLQDSLKTHPDCEERYNRTLAATTPGTVLTPVPAHIREKANKIMIWNIYCNGNLTTCLYRILLEKDKGNTDVWYDFMVHNVFAGLFYADKDLRRFNAIGVVPKELISTNYYQLQTMFEQIPRESLEIYSRTLQSASFWSKMSRNEIGLKNFLYTLSWESDNTEKSNALAAKNFLNDYASSPYCEFATAFSKK